VTPEQRRELIWSVAYATDFATRVRRLLDLGMSRDVDGVERPFYNDESIARAHAAAEHVANLAADCAIGRGPKP
jgi:hypothetical protein